MSTSGMVMPARHRQHGSRTRAAQRRAQAAARRTADSAGTALAGVARGGERWVWWREVGRGPVVSGSGSVGSMMVWSRSTQKARTSAASSANQVDRMKSLGTGGDGGGEGQ